MSRILVKDNRVAIAGGRVVTTAGGAPCCCDPGSPDNCFIRLMPCFCNDPSRIRYIGLSERINRVWPPEAREAGATVSIGGVCWIYYGTEVGPIPVELILIQDDPDPDTYANCYESPCADQTPCPPCSGGFSESRSFFPLNQYCGLPSEIGRDCLQRVVAEMESEMEYVFELYGSGANFDGYTRGRHTLASRFEWALVNNRKELIKWEVATTGNYEHRSEFDGETDSFTWSQTFTDQSPGAWGWFNAAIAFGDPSDNEATLAVPDLYDGTIDAPSWARNGIRSSLIELWNPPNAGPIACGTGQTAFETNPNGNRRDWTLDLSASAGDSGSNIAAGSTRDTRQVSPAGRTFESRAGSRSTRWSWVHIGDDYDPGEDECTIDDSGGSGGGGTGGNTGGDPGGSDAGQPGGIGDPAILAEIARQQQARTGQYPGRCPSCGG